MRCLLKLIFSALLVFGFNGPGSSSYAQERFETRVGEWRTHLPYREGQAVAQLDDRIFCITRHGLFYYDADEGSRGIIDPLMGLGGTDFSALATQPEENRVFIGYRDGTMDLMEDNRIANITDFEEFPRPGRKTINAFHLYEGELYMATAMGVLIYDPDEREFRADILNIDPEESTLNINNVVVFDNKLWAATNNGLYQASMDVPNLRDPSFWEQNSEGNFTLLEEFNETLYVVENDSLIFEKAGQSLDTLDYGIEGQINNLGTSQGNLLISHEEGVLLVERDGSHSNIDLPSPTDALFRDNGELFYSLDFHGMMSLSPDGQRSFLSPSSPRGLSYFKFLSSDDGLWGVRGSVSEAYGNQWQGGVFSNFSNNQWENFDIGGDGLIPDTLNFQDPITIEEHPSEPLFYIGSFFKGLYVFDKQNQEPHDYFNSENSGIQTWEARNAGKGFISGLAFDSRENLWIANYGGGQPLTVLTPEGEWYNFDLPFNEIGEIIMDDHDQLWIHLPVDNGLLVVNSPDQLPTNQPLDFVHLRDNEDHGDLPGNNIRAIQKDQQGRIWIGGEDGVKSISSPSRVFTEGGVQARNIFLANQEGVLLRQDFVREIEVDGGDRKWFSTQAGIWVTTPDGRNIVNHFNEDNSPLLSNNIVDMAFEGEEGLMMFSTDEGMMSLRTEGTAGQPEHSDVYAYPNPVREDHHGPIAIRGLVNNAEVNITDISGNLVYKTRAIGGQAVWEGRNMDGQEVKSGVYLVLSSDEDGEETFATKILLLR